MDNTFEITLTTPELVFVGSLLQLPQLPIESELPDDEAGLAGLWSAAQTELARKGYARLPTTQTPELALDQTVAMMVGVLGYPQSSLIAQTYRERQVEPQGAQLFGLGELIVEQTQDVRGDYVLTACRTRDVALERLVTFLGLENQPPAHDESFHIAVAAMAQTHYIIAGNGQDDGAAFLRDAGAPRRAAQRLAAALENPVRQTTIRVATRVGDNLEEVGRLTLLEEVYGLWLLAPAGEDGDTLAVSPVTAAEAIDHLRALVYRVFS